MPVGSPRGNQETRNFEGNVRFGAKPPGLRAAKRLLQQHGIDEDDCALRRLLSNLDVSLERCSKARIALTLRADVVPLETIINCLLARGLDEPLAQRICGLDTDAAAADALVRSREASAAKRSHDAAEFAKAAKTAAHKAARVEGMNMRHSHVQ